jgi:hypothetical protein
MQTPAVGQGENDDPVVLRVLAMLERRGWLGDSPPLTPDQANLSEGPSNAIDNRWKWFVPVT